MKRGKGPQFLRFAEPIVEVLRDLGGSASSEEVTDFVIDRLQISEEEQSETLKNGTSRVRNQIAWARFYLVKAGLLGSSKRGVWNLTDEGAKTSLNPEKVYAIFKEVQSTFQRKEHKRQQEDENSEDSTEPREDYRIALIGLLRNLPPSGFERICQRLLRESGFQQVTVTGKSSDGGIDGHGILQLNPLVSFKVLFQCKRYKGAVATSVVRDFRGAMQGRADKGIILTTGTFTTDAKKEATRDGASPIELIDGDGLIEMFSALELGLNPRQDFEIDEAFFKQFEE